MTLPILRVAVVGDRAALAAIGPALARLAGPAWHRDGSPLELAQGVEERTLCTRRHRVFALVAHENPRMLLARFAPDVLVVAAARAGSPVACGPSRLYGRRVFSHATPVLWLAARCRPSHEERHLRKALLAAGLPADAAEAVYEDLDPSGEHLAAALDTVAPARPDDARSEVRAITEGLVFSCRACARPVTRPLRLVRSRPPPPEPGPTQHRHRRMFPGAGLCAYAPDADRWARDQSAPLDGPRAVALFDPDDLLPEHRATTGPDELTCCGLRPARAPNMGCACGTLLGYRWGGCCFHTVIALRLELVTSAYLPR